MDRVVIAEIARQILHSEPPKKVIKLAESLLLQSSSSIPMKATVEPARAYICCVLAIEQLSSQLDLPDPDTQKPPVPPNTYMRLVDQFRQTLLGVMPQKSGPSAVSGIGSGSQSRALRRVTLRGSDNFNAGTATRDTPEDRNERKPSGSMQKQNRNSSLTEGVDRNDNVELDNDAHGETTGSDSYPHSPHKRASSGSNSAGSPERRTTPRKRARSALPTSHAVDQIGELMELATETTNAIRHAFEQYRDLVKDSWGLVYGLFAVISERAEPRMGLENLNRLDRALRDVAPPRLYIDPNEWIPWVERIVTGQTWIMKISKRPEPVAKLVGAPGGWGLGVEYTLVDS